MKITVETEINGPLAVVWDAWVTPADIVKWNYAIDEWCCPKAEISLVDGGKFNYRMEAKDGSMGFDFEGAETGVSFGRLELSNGDADYPAQTTATTPQADMFGGPSPTDSLTGAVAERPRHQPLARPAPVAIHDDGDVPRNRAIQSDAREQFGGGHRER